MWGNVCWEQDIYVVSKYLSIRHLIIAKGKIVCLSFVFILKHGFAESLIVDFLKSTLSMPFHCLLAFVVSDDVIVLWFLVHKSFFSWCFQYFLSVLALSNLTVMYGLFCVYLTWDLLNFSGNLEHFWLLFLQISVMSLSVLSFWSKLVCFMSTGLWESSHFSSCFFLFVHQIG